MQNDIKRVIAYSTCSQLGYMFVAAGVGVYSAAMFHLLTHAFFKAMLFLGAGSVIHAMHHEQDMRNYGGLRNKIPYTFWAMMIGTLAITGVGIPFTHIGFAGFLSKDAIIESAWGGEGAAATYGFWLLVLAAALTSFYSWRLMFMTFFGKPRGDRQTHEHAHESPMVMLVPLGVLALGAVFAGMIWMSSFFGEHEDVAEFFGIPAGAHAAAEDEGEGLVPAVDEAVQGDAEGAVEAITEPVDTEPSEHAAVVAPPGTGAIYMGPDNHVMDDAHHAPIWVKVTPFIAMLVGFVLAWLFYIRQPSLAPALAAQPAAALPLPAEQVVFRRDLRLALRAPGRSGSGASSGGAATGTIDGGINGLALGIVPFFTRLAGRAQSGYMFHYAFAMVLGIAVLITWMTIAGGAK